MVAREKDNAIRVHDQSAADYDRYASEFGCFVPDVLFGLCFEYVLPHQRLLDIGIGTGLSSLPFVRAGLQVSGLDGSAEMLSMCKSKDFPVELKQFDIRYRPWPYPDQSFDHAIACGVFHFIPEIAPVFQEAARLVRPNGIFAFTTKTPLKDIKRDYSIETIGEVQIASHSKRYIGELLAVCGFVKLKELKVLLSRGPGERDDIYCAWVTKKWA
jgi:predicted TPR repeat methyltransferase